VLGAFANVAVTVTAGAVAVTPAVAVTVDGETVIMGLEELEPLPPPPHAASNKVVVKAENDLPKCLPARVMTVSLGERNLYGATNVRSTFGIPRCNAC
jgi:hypothetical protein